MKIICATDFSENAVMAAGVAAALAKAANATLVLVHVADETNAQSTSGLKRFLRPVQKRLRVETERLSRSGAIVKTALLTGTWAENAIVEFAKKIRPELIIVS